MPGNSESGSAIEERIRVISARRGLSISEVGRRAGISRSTMQRIMNGQSPTVEQVEAIGGALGLHPAELLGAELGASVRNNPVRSPEEDALLEAIQRRDAVDIRRALEAVLPPETFTAVTTVPPQADLIRAVEQATDGLKALGELMKAGRPREE